LLSRHGLEHFLLSQGRLFACPECTIMTQKCSNCHRDTETRCNGNSALPASK
jgi:hypothetical protein